MKKRAVSVFLALTLCLMTCLAMAIPSFAESTLPRLVDNADLLTTSEETALLEQLDEISESQQADVVIVTTNTLDGKTPMEYADDFFDYNGYGYGVNRDGVLLLVSMEDRDWWISTSGYGITAFTDAGIDYIGDQFVGYLSDGEYAEGFSRYAELCDEFFTQAKSGAAYDVGTLPNEPFDFLTNSIYAVIMGLVLAGLITGRMKRSLKSVRF